MKTIGVCILTDAQIHAARVVCRRQRNEVSALHSVVHEVADTLFEPVDMSLLADAIAAALQGIGIVDEVRLVIPAQWCFAHGLTTEQAGRSPSERAFALEAFLPVDLETVTCAFAPLAATHVLAIAIPTAPMQELLDALAERNVNVAQLLVDVLTAAQADGVPAGGAIRIVDRRWTRSGPLLDDRGIRCAAAEYSSGPDGRLDDEFNGNSDALTIFDLRSAPPETTVQANESDVLCVGPEAIRTLARAACKPSNLDLRCGALMPPARWQQTARLLNHCLAMVVVLLTITAVCLFVHTVQLRSATETVTSAMRDLYKNTVTGEPPTGGWAMRLAAQRRQWEGVTRPVLEQDMSLDDSALDRWRDIVAAWPADVPLQLLEARLESGQVTIRGRAREHRDAERLAEAMGNVTKLVTQPPRTNRTGDGLVEFALAAAEPPKSGVKHGPR